MIARELRAAARVAAVLTAMSVFAAHSALLGLWWYTDPGARLRRQAWLGHRYAKLVLRLLGVQALRDGRLPGAPGRLIVANHLSYLDVVAMAALWPACFVTSTEVQRTPGLGWICSASACLFVNRRSYAGITGEVRRLADALEEGVDVVVFPEATSTDGSAVIPFRAGLLPAALIANAPVQPVCLNYTRLDEEAVHAGNRDLLFWYGDMDFLPHLWKLARRRRAEMVATVLEPLPPIGRASDLARQAYAAVRGSFRTIPRQPPTLAEFMAERARRRGRWARPLAPV